MENNDQGQVSGPAQNGQLPDQVQVPVPPRRGGLGRFVVFLVIAAVILTGLWWFKTNKMDAPNQVAQQPTRRTTAPEVQPPAGFPADLPMDPARVIINDTTKPATATSSLSAGSELYEVTYLSGKSLDQTLQEFNLYFLARRWKTSVQVGGPNSKSLVATSPEAATVAINFLQQGSELQVDVNYFN